MQNILQYINLSWAVVGICEGSHLPLSALVHEGDEMEETVEQYVIGYLAFWHIAFSHSGTSPSSIKNDCTPATTKLCARQPARK